LDGISDKVSFNFRLNACLEKGLLKKQPIGKTLHDVDGDFQILINDIVYFEEKEFLLLEFRVLLKKWVEKVENGERINFQYYSIEDDGTILEFRHIDQLWEIYSSWRIADEEIILSFESLLMAIKKLLLELEKELMKTFEMELNKEML
jgi:hypothetical protein